jgi:hypothetical protein
VTINAEECNTKVHAFVDKNNFLRLPKDPTEKYHKQIHKTLQQGNLVIPKQNIKHLTQRKPSPPTLKAQLKLHKPDIPIRSVVNNKQAPTYKIAKHMTKLLNKHLILNNYYNTTNSTSLATDLSKLTVTTTD